MITEAATDTKYHKIQTVYLRDPETKHKTLLDGQWSKPEFGHLAYTEWVFTEKVDGTNIRVTWDGVSVLYQGRTDRAQTPPSLLEALAEILPSGKFDGSKPMTLYGEGYGARIQKGGGNYREDQSFVLFDVRVGETWLDRRTVEGIATGLSIDVAPIIAHGHLPGMVEMAREGITSTWGDFQAEGIVARPAVELLNRHGERIITKIKCKDFPR